MRLRLLSPTEVVLDLEVTKVVGEAENGSFCLLPRHIDFAAALVPGLFYFTAADSGEGIAALDEGTLVKCGDEVLVSALHVVLGTDPDQLQARMAETFYEMDEEERRARAALARLEAGALRRFLELEKKLHGD